jgi:HAD superfamily hydrolase (TIGR01459 family)
MTKIATLSQLTDQYDALFCDVWGVIRDGRALLPEAVEALIRYRRQGGVVCLVSNSPRRGYDLIEQLRKMGFPDDACDAVVTSGDAIHEELAKRGRGPALRIGTMFDTSLYDGLELEFVDSIEDAAFISCTGPDDYWNGKPEDYRDLLARALDRKLDLVCANPDIVVQAEDQLIYCAGAIARLYREIGGTSLVAGKPHRPIYRLAEHALLEMGRPTERDRILAIGDGPETDLEGAGRFGIDAFFIADGILAADTEAEGFDPAAIAEILAGYGTIAKWIAPRLVWSETL